MSPPSRRGANAAEVRVDGPRLMVIALCDAVETPSDHRQVAMRAPVREVDGALYSGGAVKSGPAVGCLGPLRWLGDGGAP